MPESKDHVEPSPMQEVERHDHLCLLYESEAEILTPVIPFIQKGIAGGERCLYLNAGEETLERVLKNAVLGQKHDVGALILLPAQESWLKGGKFHPDRVMELLHTLISSAAADGFRGCRVICDMGWAAGNAVYQESLVDLEIRLSRFSSENDVTVLCLYKRPSFPDEVTLQVAKRHPRVVLEGKICTNDLFVPPEREEHPESASCELELFLASLQKSSAGDAERAKLRQELEQAYAALARKIYENWQDEDHLKASEREIHEKEAALLEHRRRLQTILQHLPTMLMAFDTSHRLAACNHEFERITGYRAEEVMGKEMLELFVVEEGERTSVTAAHPPEGGHYRCMEWNLRCKDGSLKNVSWSNISRYIPIQGWNNWIMGLDVTPRVHAERGLKSLTDEVEAFGCAVSNDLSGQLSKISSHCAIMQERYGVALSPQCRELLHSIQETTLEMVGRIKALQRFTSLSCAELNREEVDLSTMASEIAADLSASGAGRSVTFEIEDGVTATGDSKLLRVALEQLLENAWNYTMGVPHPVIHFGTTEVNGEKSFYVSDNGSRSDNVIGQQNLRRVGRGEHLSCGIGLATVQRIIALHRGRIWASDEAGKGRTLFFTV